MLQRGRRAVMELPAGGGPAPSIRGMRDREEYWVTDPDNGNCPAAIGIETCHRDCGAPVGPPGSREGAGAIATWRPIPT
jgi:hypothetical protein